MKNDNDKYAQTIKKLKETLPVQENPERLTASIIEKIGPLPRRGKADKVWAISGWTSGIAAAMLICLFAVEWNTRTAAWQPADKMPEMPATTLSAETINQMKDIREKRKMLYSHISSYSITTNKIENDENK